MININSRKRILFVKAMGIKCTLHKELIISQLQLHEKKEFNSLKPTIGMMPSDTQRIINHADKMPTGECEDVVF